MAGCGAVRVVVVEDVYACVHVCVCLACMCMCMCLGCMCVCVRARPPPPASSVVLFFSAVHLPPPCPPPAHPRTRPPPVPPSSSPSPPLLTAAAAGPTSGGVVIVRGSNFGPSSLNAVDEVVYEPGGLPLRFHATCAVSVDDVELTCVTPGGVGALLLWSVTIAGQRSTNPRTGYMAPVVGGLGAVEPASGAPVPLAVLPTSGIGPVLVFTGDYFGAVGLGVPVTAVAVGLSEVRVCRFPPPPHSPLPSPAALVRSGCWLGGV
jgi:hypothetical protein